MSTSDYERELKAHYDKVHKRLVGGNGCVKNDRPLPPYQRHTEKALAGILKRLQGIEDWKEKLERAERLERTENIDNSYPHYTHPLCKTVHKILDIVSEGDPVLLNQILSPKRNKGISELRHIVYYLASRWTAKSFVQIGRALGRDHSTVLTTVRKMARKRALDADLNAKIWRYEQRLECLEAESRKKSVDAGCQILASADTAM